LTIFEFFASFLFVDVVRYLGVICDALRRNIDRFDLVMAVNALPLQMATPSNYTIPGLLRTWVI